MEKYLVLNDYSQILEELLLKLVYGEGLTQEEYKEYKNLSK